MKFFANISLLVIACAITAQAAYAQTREEIDHGVDIFYETVPEDNYNNPGTDDSDRPYGVLNEFELEASSLAYTTTPPFFLPFFVGIHNLSTMTAGCEECHLLWFGGQFADVVIEKASRHADSPTEAPIDQDRLDRIYGEFVRVRLNNDSDDSLIGGGFFSQVIGQKVDVRTEAVTENGVVLYGANSVDAMIGLQATVVPDLQAHNELGRLAEDISEETMLTTSEDKVKRAAGLEGTVGLAVHSQSRVNMDEAVGVIGAISRPVNNEAEITVGKLVGMRAAVDLRDTDTDAQGGQPQMAFDTIHGLEVLFSSLDEDGLPNTANLEITNPVHGIYVSDPKPHTPSSVRAKSTSILAEGMIEAHDSIILRTTSGTPMIAIQEGYAPPKTAFTKDYSWINNTIEFSEGIIESHGMFINNGTTFLGDDVTVTGNLLVEYGEIEADAILSNGSVEAQSLLTNKLKLDLTTQFVGDEYHVIDASVGTYLQLNPYYDVTLTSSNPISSAATAGAGTILILGMQSGHHYSVTIQSTASNVKTPSNRVIMADRVLTLISDGAKWIEISYSGG